MEVVQFLAYWASPRTIRPKYVHSALWTWFLRLCGGVDLRSMYKMGRERRTVCKFSMGRIYYIINHPPPVLIHLD